MNERYPIPRTLNLVIAAAQITVLLAILSLTAIDISWWGTLLLAVAYAVAMNSAYAMLHEAEHNLFHPNRRINTVAGVALALFFPAPFHLLRQGHIGHHRRNRSDDEAFDFYFEGESAVWKNLQLYGILTGLFWVVIVMSNLIAVFRPRLLCADSAKSAAFDRSTEALIETLNPKYLLLIWLEALAVFFFHGGLIWLLGIPLWRYGAVLFGFGFVWSAMQYVHHFGTVRDVREGARNLRAFALLDLIWLNHNWHLNHHMRPTVPWIHLPHLNSGEETERANMIGAYIRMWRGPRKTMSRVENRYAGKIIR